ncbi:MAG: bifunctional precorrin-2 dehydrogenase/sirohydrochlorin ferrochelatase, partial [Sedimenticolaceae bacterium]
MEHLPIFLSVRDQICAVIGGGEIATRKVSLLLRAGARVRIIAPQLCANLSTLHDQDRVTHLARGYQDGDLDNAYLAIAATDDADVNRAVADAGRARNIPVNVV